MRSYLNAWLPILGRRTGRILFIDRFAGPGEYENGEEGSPIIAMRALIDHNAQKTIQAEVGFIFIEKDEARAAHLQEITRQWGEMLPKDCWTNVIQGKFDETMTDVLDGLEDQRRRLAPAFIMIDPFGVSETPMSVIERILANPKSEVYISFMYGWINRFCNQPEFASPLDKLFGCQAWRKCADIEDSAERQICFYALYEQQLRTAGAKNVVTFNLYEGERLKYGTFFATGHWLGANKMKAAIWKVAPSGDFAFKGTRSAQLTLGIDNPNFEPLKEALRNEFQSSNWVPVESVMQFVGSDKTDYHTSQVRQGALIPFENDGEIEVRNRKQRRRFPKGCQIRFV